MSKTVDTDGLIEQLAGDTQPARPLPSPWRRTLAWLALSILYAALVVIIIGPRPQILDELREPRFLIEQLATAATAILAAFAAFSSVIPGRPRWILFTPLVPLALWLFMLGAGCLLELQQTGGSIILQAHWTCVPAILGIGLVPAILIAVMLRRGAPMYPHTAIALGGIAAAALGNLGLWTYHPEDAGFMVLAWHMGTVALVAAIAGWLGPRIHHWNTNLPKSESVEAS